MADVSEEDMQAAVASGVLDERQAARLKAFADARAGFREQMPKDDEPFEFFRGFGEIFISVGLMLLLGAVATLAPVDTLTGGGLGYGVVMAIGLGLSVALTGYFARRRRMSLPSIVLTSWFAYFLASLVVVGFLSFDWQIQDIKRFGGLAACLAAAAGMAVYYLAFRVPFTMLPLGLFVFAFILAASLNLTEFNDVLDDPATVVFDLAQSPGPAAAMLIFGLLAFAAAIWFDLKDPYRLSRHSATAFWLHVLAAPALVNTICLTLYNVGGAVGYLAATLAFFVMAALALIVDRRSFLLSGVAYFGLAIYTAFSAVGGDSFLTTTLTVGGLGAGMAALGAQWPRVRSAFMAALPDFPGKQRLPPY